MSWMLNSCCWRLSRALPSLFILLLSASKLHQAFKDREPRDRGREGGEAEGCLRR